MDALPGDLWPLVGSHLPPRDLLSFASTCRAARRAAAAAIAAVTIDSSDGVDVRVYLHPPGGPHAGGGSLREAEPPPTDPAHLVVAGRLGAAHARSLLSFLRATRPHALRVQRHGSGAHQQLHPRDAGPPSGPTFFNALLGGLAALPLRQLALDAAAVAAMAPAHRLPPRMDGLCLTDLGPGGGATAPRPTATPPAVHAALAAGTLRTLRVLPRAQYADLPNGCPAYLAHAQPALRHLAVGCCLDAAALAAIARWDALTTLHLSSRTVDGGLATLALPALPALQHLHLGACPRSRRSCVQAVLRGRALQSLSLGVPPYGDASGVVHTLTAARELPTVVDLRSGTAHTDVRPLADHPGRGALRSLSCTLGGDAGLILAAVAAGCPSLRELSLSFIGGAGEFFSWPPALRLTRLSLDYGTGGRRGVDANGVLAGLGGSPSMRRHLRGLAVSADLAKALSNSTILALGKLHRLTSSTWSIRGAWEWHHTEAVLRATVCGRVHTHWVAKTLPAHK